MSPSERILIIVTNTAEYENAGYRTGLWLGELTHFYDYAEQAGIGMDLASPRGGFVPIDPESLARDVLNDLGTGRRYADRAFMDLLDRTRPLGAVDADAYRGIYLTGGHGVMFDFRHDPALNALITRMDQGGRVVSAVCHGPAGLLDATREGGEPFVRGREVTGFSWREEELAGRDRVVPFSLQEELKARGGSYSTAGEPFGAHVVQDGNLITGQNPGSARGVAEAVVRQVKATVPA
ncbi:type 1 glutamine amidotransferase domain-containing protein [Spongiactinospora sp. TRM90649]|uniref:type 1 glutamine amidotransferase domain-containing protein n=1 Tax=Spongiactinospora sp. TRM90649 TaxID=3031114 RepID=UPI0023F801C3|nr:type 1 glutamine amidotransferase domain-containing protein [Spongiactinospora sp. TRM90649]MDF5756687.1 type 1 glutamine amidotransferase domain-containing protein [Spongiactinospora sp. TRM90649]